MNPSESATFDVQYQALRSGCGVVQLSNWSSVTFTGHDRQEFLHNFCTNDIKRLTPGQSCEAFFTNVKGKILGHGLVTCRKDELVVIGPPGQGERLAAHLDRYVIREDVIVRDTTAERSYILLCGGEEAHQLAASLGVINDGAKLGGRSVHWVQWNVLDSDFCGLLGVTGDASPVRQIWIERGAVPCDEPTFHTRRIEAGTPLFGVDFNDDNLPQEVGRNEKAISFTKGCYLGQETVARIDALGHVNQQLVGVRFSGAKPPDIGAALRSAGKTVGHVTSATFSPQLQAPLALAMVRRPYNDVGSRMDSPLGPCEVVSLPV